MSIPHRGRFKKKWSDETIKALYQNPKYKTGEYKLKDLSAQSGIPVQTLSYRFKQLERLEKTPIKRGIQGPGEVAKASTLEVLSREVAEESIKRTTQYIETGKKAAPAYWKYVEAKGIPIAEAVKHPIEKIIPEALDKAAQHGKLVRRIRELEETVSFYQKELDPIIRLKNATIILQRFLEFIVLADLVGFNVEDTPLIDHYQALIELYLKGGP